MDALSLQEIAALGKPGMARALTFLEREAGSEAATALLDQAYAAPRAQVIGLTGPPGVGKSTLAGALINSFRAQDLTVGVIAVDPSSRRSGG
ncbi:MAG: ATP/GTP-binding protein, partial [Limibacillus sp.]